MVKRKFDFDLIVLGSGAGGSAAANIAVKAGLKVAIVENDLFGGESPNYTDIPRAAISKVKKAFFFSIIFSLNYGTMKGKILFRNGTDSYEKI